MEAVPIQDGRGLEKNQNGFGVGAAGDPSYTLDSVGGQSVAVWGEVPLPAMLGNSNKAKEISNCIPASIYHHGTVVNQDADAGHVIVDMIQYQIAVRKLTPVECERLQSFPEGWTDGQVDTGRYKQMGNAVTVAVVAWIGARL